MLVCGRAYSMRDMAAVGGIQESGHSIGCSGSQPVMLQSQVHHEIVVCSHSGPVVWLWGRQLCEVIARFWLGSVVHSLARQLHEAKVCSWMWPGHGVGSSARLGPALCRPWFSNRKIGSSGRASHDR